MKIIETELAGLKIIQTPTFRDSRGYFARLWTPEQMKGFGLETELHQVASSYNEKAYTLRGMHFQKPPYQEDKLVRCIRGRLFDAVIDFRPNSPTFKKTFSIELNADSETMLFIPKGFAHGYLTLEPKTEILYFMTSPYIPASGDGLRWDDPAFKINWPKSPEVIAERDATYPLYSD